MKTLNTLVIGTLLSLKLATPALPAEPDAAPAATPTMDSEGRYWVYRNGPTHPKMPFTPYGYMSDVTNNLTQLIRVDLENRDRPNSAFKISGQRETEYCIQVKLTWTNASWAGVAFISGPDKPPWWGETNRGKYVNLSGMPKKKLVFYARGQRGGEMIKVQLGALSGKPFGDSLSKPVVSDEYKLTKDWARYEVDLSAVPGAELAKVCNGFGFVADQSSQPGPGTETQFYLDDIYFE